MDNNVNSNGIKYDPVTGQPIQPVYQVPPQPQVPPQMGGDQMQPQPQIQVNGPMNFDPMTGQPLRNMQQMPNQGQVPVQPIPPKGRVPVQPIPPQGQMPVQQMPSRMNNGQVPQQQITVVPVNNVPGYVNTDDDNGACKTLCLASLLCLVCSPIVTTLVSYWSDYFDGITYIQGLAGLAFHVGLVLMIIARVKYPKSKFAKVLMWIYIAIYILSAIAIILAIVACVSCVNSFGSCSGMG